MLDIPKLECEVSVSSAFKFGSHIFSTDVTRSMVYSFASKMVFIMVYLGPVEIFSVCVICYGFVSTNIHPDALNSFNRVSPVEIY